MTLSTRLPKIFDDADLSRHFRSAENGDKRPNGVFDGAFEVFDFFLEEEAGGRGGNEFGDADGGGMGPVCGAERVVDIDIAEGRQGFGEAVVVFLFARMESEIFKEQDVARLHLGDKPFHGRADAIRCKQNVFAHEPSQAFCYRGQTVFGIELSVRSAEVRTEDHLGAVVDGSIDGRQGRANAGVVGDLVRIVQRDVEVGSDDDALVSQHDIVDRLFAQIHGGSVRSVLPGRGVSVKQNRAEAGIDLAVLSVLSLLPR